jgi:putative FmdB family regulatory protein
MPTYLYSCECGNESEVFHEMTATVRIVCPNCVDQMSRKPSIGAVMFKGTGWGKDA